MNDESSPLALTHTRTIEHASWRTSVSDQDTLKGATPEHSVHEHCHSWSTTEVTESGDRDRYQQFTSIRLRVILARFFQTTTEHAYNAGGLGSLPKDSGILGFTFLSFFLNIVASWYKLSGPQNIDPFPCT